MADEAFVAFYRRHYRLVLTVAQQRLRGAADAEDVTSAVFRIALEHHRKGNVLELAWVYATLRNVIGNEYRRSGRADRLAERIAGVSEHEVHDPPSDEVMQMRRYVESLPEGPRELLFMAYWEDLTTAEIAAIRQCTAVSVRVQLHRARKQLKALIETDVREGVVVDG